MAAKTNLLLEIVDNLSRRPLTGEEKAFVAANYHEVVENVDPKDLPQDRFAPFAQMKFLLKQYAGKKPEAVEDDSGREAAEADRAEALRMLKVAEHPFIDESNEEKKDIHQKLDKAFKNFLERATTIRPIDHRNILLLLNQVASKHAAKKLGHSDEVPEDEAEGERIREERVEYAKDFQVRHLANYLVNPARAKRLLFEEVFGTGGA